ncbi:hypothetical protein ACSVBT_06935 [Afipia sp. TerB]
MSTSSLTSPISAKSGGAETGIDFSVLGIGLSVNSAANLLLKAKEPRKTWGFLCDLVFRAKRIEMTERVAKHRLAETRDYSGEELRALLQSDHGYEFLQLLMEDAKPRWWSMVEQAMALARARHHQEMARQEVLSLESAPLEIPARRKAKRIVDADRKLTSSRSQQETALGFLLADTGRPLHRAVARAKRA